MAELHSGRDFTLHMVMKFMIAKREGHDNANPDLMNFVLNYLLPPIKNEDDLKLRISRLQKFTSLLLNIPLSVVRETGIITVGSEGMANFESIVLYTLQSIKKLLSEGKCERKVEDLISENIYYHEHSGHETFELGLFSWPALFRVIGPSMDRPLLLSDKLTQSLRMISILYELNEHWSTLFCNMSTQQLISKDAFEFIDLETCLSDATSFFQFKYPFLVKSQARIVLLKDNIPRSRVDKKMRSLFTVERKNALIDITKSLTKYSSDFWTPWDFTFINETGTGDGPTKEFYTKVSLDCSRYDLDLWIGEPMTSKDGNVYVNSPCGLFPSPCTKLNKRSRKVLWTIGRLMAKSLLEGRLMDLNFSKALYKCMFAEPIHKQRLKLSDIKHVMPSLSKFVEGMVDVMKEAHLIKADSSLTLEQRSERISNLRYDGCRLEDLCINFTVPGFSEIEMMEGGSNIILTAENVDDYLSLLAWWFFHKGIHEKLECLRKGFQSVISTQCFGRIEVEEIEQIFCGIKTEPWMYDDLEQNCQLEDGLTMHTPVIRKLFRVMTEFSCEERELFLKFVTSSPKLPPGGLKNLRPKLKIKKIVRDSNNDAYFPSSATCYNSLFIPDYSNLDILKERLSMAIRYGAESFDFI